METKQKRMTFDDIADFYKEKTGGRAKIKPIDMILDWAEKQTDSIRVDKEGYFYLKENYEKSMW